MIRDPERLHAAFGEALNRADVEELLSFFAPDTVYVAPPGRWVRGTDEEER